jgi:hypothetical protein
LHVAPKPGNASHRLLNNTRRWAMNEIDPKALFKLSVLGPIVKR